jgi:hypothetical protein
LNHFINILKHDIGWENNNEKYQQLQLAPYSYASVSSFSSVTIRKHIHSHIRLGIYTVMYSGRQTGIFEPTICEYSM